jgi:hypothetical protein
LVLVSVGDALAQTITYKELEYVQIHDFKSCSEILIKRGFKIEKLYTPVGNYPEYFYQFVKGTGEKEMTVRKKSYKTGAFTYSKDDYLFLKASIKNSGFMIDSTTMILTNRMEWYHKGNLRITFVSMPVPGYKNKALTPGYYIDLIDIELDKKRDWYRIEY